MNSKRFAGIVERMHGMTPEEIALVLTFGGAAVFIAVAGIGIWLRR